MPLSRERRTECSAPGAAPAAGRLSGVLGGALQLHGVRRRRATVPSTCRSRCRAQNAPATIATPGPAVAPRKMAVAAAQPAPAAMAPTRTPQETRAQDVVRRRLRVP